MSLQRQKRDLNMKQGRQYSYASSLLTQICRLCANTALGEDCFLNAVEYLSYYKGNEYRGTRDALLDLTSPSASILSPQGSFPE